MSVHEYLGVYKTARLGRVSYLPRMSGERRERKGWGSIGWQPVSDQIDTKWRWWVPVRNGTVN